MFLGNNCDTLILLNSFNYVLKLFFKLIKQTIYQKSIENKDANLIFFRQWFVPEPVN